MVPAPRPTRCSASLRHKNLAVPLFAGLSLAAPSSSALDRVVSFPTESGTSSTFRRQPGVTGEDPFFDDLGGNGRSCASSHRPEDGWSITPRNLQQRFDGTAGLDPIFRLHGGANQMLVDVGTLEDRRSAYSLLLAKGLIRIVLPTPLDAEFELAALSDPYANDQSGGPELSLFRRPLPVTILRFLNAVIWDGRESLSESRIRVALENQVNTAAMGRALVTGLWRDIWRFKMPGLRELAARATCFHNGLAREICNVVDFYDSRFGVGLDNRERLDLILFLGAL